MREFFNGLLALVSQFEADLDSSRFREAGFQVLPGEHRPRVDLVDGIMAASKLGLAVVPFWGRATRLNGPASGDSVAIADSYHDSSRFGPFSVARSSNHPVRTRWP